MRPLVIAVLLLSCVSDPSRRTQASSPPVAVPVPVIVADAPPAAAQSATAPAIAPGEAPAASPPVLLAARTPAAPVDPRAAARQAAHDVLAQHCGECHEGHRSDKPKALAVFDLDQPDWPSRFDAHRFASALGRLAKKPDPASAVFIAFRDAELASAKPN
ncbi:MAG: hypothetical protein E6J90_50890 [Deltaproteobacteria bacterium]|nr:MAG: hypothetical protein E6J90_50890 [Deltaproteobacteria bacterium]TMQ08001.1 MAG: hypothetical protein E6J91_34275 [Deltaproteobacteria bacterium]